MNKMQKEILKQLEKIVEFEDKDLPKNEQAYITDCNWCGAILVNTKLVSGRSLMHFESGNAFINPFKTMMCINCKFVNDQKIMINDERLRQQEKELRT